MQDSNAELTAIALGLIIFVTAVLLYPYYAQIKAIQDNFWFYLILIIIVITICLILWLVTHLSYKFTQFMYHGITSLKDEAKYQKTKANEIENLLLTKLPIAQKELTSYIKRIMEEMRICKETKGLSFLIPELKKRIAKATELLEKLEEKEVVRDIQIEKQQAQEELQKIQDRVKEEQRAEEFKKEKIARDLKIDDYFDPQHVFKKEDLSKRAIEVLIENGFHQINDYCIYEKRFNQFLVKPILNHSVVHTFLVWGAKKILKDIKEVKEIEEHETKDADITFKYQGDIYALEIETGSLLYKKKQLAGKLNYLNRKYPNRWMFIVSNRNLLPKYRKLGFSTPRNEVYEKLEKLLGIQHLF